MPKIKAIWLLLTSRSFSLITDRGHTGHFQRRDLEEMLEVAEDFERWLIQEIHTDD